MTSIEGLWVEPAFTTDRIAAAWAPAAPAARRAVIAACATSVALGIIAPVALPVRWAAALTGVLLALAALVDVHELKLPNRLLAAALAVTLVGAIGARDRHVFIGCMGGLLVAGGAMLAVRLARGVGMGDVKMAAVIGASCGSFTLLAAPVAVGVAALVATVHGGLARCSRVALGPALWFGWAVAVASAYAGWWA